MNGRQAAPASGQFHPRRSRRPVSTAVADLVSATAGRRIRARRTNRQLAVYGYRAPRLEPTDDEKHAAEPRSIVAARLTRLRERRPAGPVGRTVLRPVADTASTLTVLRDLARGK